MEITTVLNAHSNYNIVADTIESIHQNVGKNILVVIDGASKELKNSKFNAYTINGFYHNSPKAPYRNMALGLWKAYEMFPQSTWFCYCEYDCLFASNSFKYNLEIADKNDVWLLGNDVHKDNYTFPLIEALIKENIKACYYVLGCCVFFCKEFIEKLIEIDFFNRFINATNHFTEGFFPNYTDHDISEHLYPTLAVHFGGDIGSFAKYDLKTRTWSGSFMKFPMRWQPPLSINENFREAAILHPIKNWDDEIRKIHREKRKCILRQA